jgi:hypothetical protein
VLLFAASPIDWEVRDLKSEPRYGISVFPARAGAEEEFTDVPVSELTISPEEDLPAVEIAIEPVGQVWCAGKPRTMEDLKEILFFCAERARDEESPNKPSRTGVVLVAGVWAPWRDVHRAMITCADPAVRIWRLYWLVKDWEGRVALLDVFLPSDRGLRRDRPDYPRVRVELIREAPAAPTVVKLNGTEIGRDSGGIDALGARLTEIPEMPAGLPVELSLSDLVPFRDAVRAVGALRAAGVPQVFFVGAPPEPKRR